MIGKYRTGKINGACIGDDKKFRIPTTFFDLISILLGLFMFISMLQAQHIKKEFQIKLDIVKRQMNSTQSAQPDVDTPSLSITGSAGQQSFIFSSAKMKNRTLSKGEEVKELLAELRPAKMILRVDKNIPAGVMQNVIMDCQDLHVLPFLSAQSVR